MKGGHVYEEVIPRGHRAECIVSVSVWRWQGRWWGGGGGPRGLWELMAGSVCPRDSEEKLCTDGKLMNRSAGALASAHQG